MTTAARPTFSPALGGGGQGDVRPGGSFAVTEQYSAKDQTSHTKLKLRQPSQLGPSYRDQVSKVQHGKTVELKSSEETLKELRELSKNIKFYDNDKDIDDNDEIENTTHDGHAVDVEISPESVEKLHADSAHSYQANANQIDLDSGNEIEEDTDEDEDEDETELLLLELEKIKQERELERRKQAAKNAELQDQQAFRGNPLLNQDAQSFNKSGFRVKRRWDEDVVFRNQDDRDSALTLAGGSKKTKEFINDLVRSPFHRKFMDKYIK